MIDKTFVSCDDTKSMVKKIPIFLSLFFLTIFSLFSFSRAPQTYAYDKGNCKVDGAICYTGSDKGADFAPGYQCGIAQGYVYENFSKDPGDGDASSFNNHVSACSTNPFTTGFCCIQGTAQPPLPDHKKPGGGSYSLGGDCINTTSICYDGSNSNSTPGEQCGTLTGWHLGNDGNGHTARCGTGFCCDPGSANAPPPNPCPSEHGICTKIDTAVGTIDVSGPGGFIKTAFGVLLSISGGVALLLIIFSGYRIMAAQGDPEKLKEAREMLTSAIIGLLFMIFSVTILQILGVDILHIPGFSK